MAVVKAPSTAEPEKPKVAVPQPHLQPEAAEHEQQQRDEESRAARAEQGVQGAVEPPADHIPVQDFIDNGTFDEVLHDLASQNFEAMLDPPTYDGHD